VAADAHDVEDRPDGRRIRARLGTNRATASNPNEFPPPTLVRAPLSGKVLEVNVTPGEYRGAVSKRHEIQSEDAVDEPEQP
jgi:hypothetical protein